MLLKVKRCIKEVVVVACFMAHSRRRGGGGGPARASDRDRGSLVKASGAVRVQEPEVLIRVTR